MFGAYFPAVYFAPAYFPPVLESAPPGPPAVTGFGPGWDLSLDVALRARKRRDVFEALLRDLVARATDGAPPAVVDDVIAAVGNRATVKRRAAPAVERINWAVVMRRTDAQLERLEARLRDLVAERAAAREDEEEAVLLLLM